MLHLCSKFSQTLVVRELGEYKSCGFLVIVLLHAFYLGGCVFGMFFDLNVMHF